MEGVDSCPRGRPIRHLAEVFLSFLHSAEASENHPCAKQLKGDQYLYSAIASGGQRVNLANALRKI
jgi:hypothetical protein